MGTFLFFVTLLPLGTSSFLYVATWDFFFSVCFFSQARGERFAAAWQSFCPTPTPDAGCCSCSCPVPAASRPPPSDVGSLVASQTSPGTIFKCFRLPPKREMFGNVKVIERTFTTLGGNEPWRAMATKQKHCDQLFNDVSTEIIQF